MEPRSRDAGRCTQPLALALLLLSLAASVGAASGDLSTLDASGGRLSARVELPGGLAADLDVVFEQASGLDPESLLLSAEVVDPSSAALRSRLPTGVTVPEQFPVLLRIQPNPQGKLTFRGPWALELATENLQFRSYTPLRLFKAPDGGAFQDVTESMGAGSYRVRGLGADFSDFLIVADLRPFRAILEVKVARLAALLEVVSPAIDPGVADDLASRLKTLVDALEAGDLGQAILAVDGFRQTVREASAELIPDVSEPRQGLVGVAGRLLAAAASLRHSLLLKLQAAPGGTGGVTRQLQLSGGVAATLSLSWDESFEMDFDHLGIEAERIDPNDPALLARLPAKVVPVAAFPLLLKIAPDLEREQAFGGVWTLELSTENLSFVADTPLRLFKAEEGGRFEDITATFGLGSYRVRGLGADFSEFLVAADGRSVDEVIGGKLARLEDELDRHAAEISAPALGELADAVGEVRGLVEQGATEEALQAIDGLRSSIDAHRGDGVPGVWRSGDPAGNVAGALTALAASLRFSVTLKNTPPTFDPADVNRDGRVDVADVLVLIQRVFGGGAVP